jgi:hypothetical protein
VPKVEVALERGSKRTFAVAIDHPGWSRAGRDEASALQALVDRGPRYARAMKRKKIAFAPPESVHDLAVVERHKGGSGTDFGVPSADLEDEPTPLSASQLRALTAALDACRAEFDAAAKAARGKKLATGPRGGGRELAKIVLHVTESEEAYAAAVGIRSGAGPKASVDERMKAARAALDEAIAARERGELPERGPRGGDRWRARHAIRRSAWHWLDHAWEIEDRSKPLRPEDAA